jgi:hypothetical protein
MMGGLTARRWMGFAVILFLAAGYVFLVGASAAGLDIREKCELAGVPFMVRPGSIQFRELQQVYPMHAWCNDSYDLVPGWVNPALASLMILTLTAVTCSVVLSVKKALRASRA